MGMPHAAQGTGPLIVSQHKDHIGPLGSRLIRRCREGPKSGASKSDKKYSHKENGLWVEKGNQFADYIMENFTNPQARTGQTPLDAKIDVLSW